jgi:hypothetical protein
MRVFALDVVHYLNKETIQLFRTVFVSCRAPTLLVMFDKTSLYHWALRRLLCGKDMQTSVGSSSKILIMDYARSELTKCEA